MQVVDGGYAMGRDRVDSFRGGPVALWFRQEKAVPKAVVLDLAAMLGRLGGEVRREGVDECHGAELWDVGGDVGVDGPRDWR